MGLGRSGGRQASAISLCVDMNGGSCARSFEELSVVERVCARYKDCVRLVGILFDHDAPPGIRPLGGPSIIPRMTFFLGLLGRLSSTLAGGTNETRSGSVQCWLLDELAVRPCGRQLRPSSASRRWPPQSKARGRKEGKAATKLPSHSYAGRSWRRSSGAAPQNRPCRHELRR